MAALLLRKLSKNKSLRQKRNEYIFAQVAHFLHPTPGAKLMTWAREVISKRCYNLYTKSASIYELRDAGDVCPNSSLTTGKKTSQAIKPDAKACLKRCSPFLRPCFWCISVTLNMLALSFGRKGMLTSNPVFYCTYLISSLSTNPAGTAHNEAGFLSPASPFSPASPISLFYPIFLKKIQNNLVQPKSGLNFVLYNSRFDVVEENTGYLPVDDKIIKTQTFANHKKFNNGK